MDPARVRFWVSTYELPPGPVASWPSRHKHRLKHFNSCTVQLSTTTHSDLGLLPPRNVHSAPALTRAVGLRRCRQAQTCTPALTHRQTNHTLGFTLQQSSPLTSAVVSSLLRMFRPPPLTNTTTTTRHHHHRDPGPVPGWPRRRRGLPCAAVHQVRAKHLQPAPHARRCGGGHQALPQQAAGGWRRGGVNSLSKLLKKAVGA